MTHQTPQDLERLADALLIDAVEIGHALERANLEPHALAATARIFVLPRAQAARDLRHAARNFALMPDLTEEREP